MRLHLFRAELLLLRLHKLDLPPGFHGIVGYVTVVQGVHPLLERLLPRFDFPVQIWLLDVWLHVQGSLAHGW